MNTYEEKLAKLATTQYYTLLSADFYAENADETIVLHHVDQSMKKDNPARYHMWLPQDVVPMTRRAHMRLHQKGKPMSKSERIKRKATSAQSSAKRQLHKLMTIRMTNGSQVKYAATQIEAARMLGVSRQQIYYVLSTLPQYNSYQKAAGWRLEYV